MWVANRKRLHHSEHRAQRKVCKNRSLVNLPSTSSSQQNYSSWQAQRPDEIHMKQCSFSALRHSEFVKQSICKLLDVR